MISEGWLFLNVTLADYRRLVVVRRTGLVVFVLAFFMALANGPVLADTFDFNTMLNALKDNAEPIIKLTVAVAYVAGFWLIISAINQLKVFGQMISYHSQSHGMAGPLTKLIVGVLLFYLPGTIDIGVWTIWGHSAFTSNGASYMEYTASSTDIFGPTKEGVIALIRVIGYISFVRGFMILSRSGEQNVQPGTFSKGIIHVVGGIAAINIVETIRVIGNTLGINIL